SNFGTSQHNNLRLSHFATIQGLKFFCRPSVKSTSKIVFTLEHCSGQSVFRRGELVLVFPRHEYVGRREVMQVLTLCAPLRRPEGTLLHGDKQNEGEPVNNDTNPDLKHVLGQAKEELKGLLKLKGEVTKRIGTAKQTISGLANLFGNQVLDDE